MVGGGGGGTGGLNAWRHTHPLGTVIDHMQITTFVRYKAFTDTKSAYKSVKTALLLSNVIDVDHQNSCLFTNKGHFSLPL